MSVEGTLFAENIGTMRTHNSFHVVMSPHVRSQIGSFLKNKCITIFKLIFILSYLTALWARQVLEACHMDFKSVDVESCLGGELLVTIWTFLD